MKKILWLSLSVISIVSCGGTTNTEEVKNADDSAVVYTYLALGDSYTIGESVEEKDRFPNQLAAKLTTTGKNVELTNIARTGWTTDELQQGITTAAIEGKKYDLVTLLIGVNNEFRGRTLEEYKPGFTALLDQAIAFAGGDKKLVYVVSIPDYNFTPYGQSSGKNTSARIDAFNAAAKEISLAKGVTFVDITDISREGIKKTTLVADDGLHPSGEQYKLWVDRLFPLVSRQL